MSDIKTYRVESYRTYVHRAVFEVKAKSEYEAQQIAAAQADDHVHHLHQPVDDGDDDSYIDVTEVPCSRDA